MVDAMINVAPNGRLIEMMVWRLPDPAPLSVLKPYIEQQEAGMIALRAIAPLIAGRMAGRHPPEPPRGYRRSTTARYGQ